MKPWGEKLLAKVGQLTAQAGGEQPETAGKTDAAPVKTDVPPPPPPKPVTRKAYMDTLLKLQSEYRNMEESKRMVWLEKADGILRKMDHPVTAEELNALTETWKLYSTADEYMRFVPAREKARKALQAKLAAAEEAREKEAQEQLRRKEEKERQAAEQKQIESRLAEEQKEYQAKIDARFAKLRQELDSLNTGMVNAILSYENIRNDEAFEKIMDQVKYYSVPVVCDTPGERKAIGVFQSLMRYAPGAYKGYKEFIDRCATLSFRAGFEVRLNGRRTLIKLDGINPDGSIRYRTFSDQTGILKLSKRELGVFKNRLGRSAGAQAAFYYSVLSRTMDDTMIRQAPNPFWRMVYQNYKTLLQK